jgi:hypothetical protein
VHRFFCENPTCPRKIFTEPLTALAERYARRTNQLREELLTLGWALGGQAGARKSRRSWHAHHWDHPPLAAAPLWSRD